MGFYDDIKELEKIIKAVEAEVTDPDFKLEAELLRWKLGMIGFEHDVEMIRKKLILAYRQGFAAAKERSESNDTGN